MSGTPTTVEVVIPKGEPWDSARRVVETLRSRSHEAWLVGGCARDLVLGHVVHDVDVTTSARPEQVESIFAKTVAVGRSFGVVIVVTEAGLHIEVATFRQDGSYHDGRRPDQVSYASAIDDVERRDFTINALLLSPETESVGRIVDHVGGLEDLRQRRLCTVGDPRRRFAEDRLRILRGLRFAARLELAIESKTWQALCSSSLSGLSTERLVQEWEKSLLGSHPSRWLHLLVESGHHHVLYPSDVPFTTDDRDAVMVSLDRLDGDEPVVVRQCLWLHRAPLPETDQWVKSLPLSRQQAERLRWLLAKPPPDEVAVWSRHRLRRLMQDSAVDDLLALWRCRYGMSDALARLSACRVEERRNGPWQALVRASDLLAAGWTAGPGLGWTLKALEDAQLDGLFTSRQDGLELARRWTREAASRQEKPGVKSLPER